MGERGAGSRPSTRARPSLTAPPPRLGVLQIVMARDPHKAQPTKPFWKLLAHAGQPHQA